MKKLLLSLACFLAFIGTVNAETVSVTFSSLFDANSTALEAIELDNDFIVGFAKGSGSTAPQYYTNGTAVRWYGGNTMTVTSESNTITKIEITFGGSDGSNQISVNSGTYEGSTWTGSASSVVFTVGGTSGNRRVAGLTITYGEDTGGGNTGGGTTDPSTPNETLNVTYDSSTKGYANAQEISTVEEGVVTIEFNKGSNSNTPKYYTSGTAVRVYGGGYFTVSVPANCTITTIELTYGGTPGTNAITTDVGTFSTPTWTGEAQSVKFTIGGTSGNRQIKAISVTYVMEGTLAVAAPKISCTDNTVTISCETEDAEIYYTLDNTEPSQSSTKYANPFAITENLTVKAIAYKDGEASAVSTYNAIYVGKYNGFEALVNAGANAEGIVSGPITAIYQNGQYLYVVDNLNYPMLVYGTVSQNLTNGQTISEISGTYAPYSGLPELTSPKLGTIGTGIPVSPQNVTDAVNNDMINRYVKFENVTIDANKNMTYGNNTMVLYSRFNDVTFPTDFTKNYNITGFVSIFNGTLQIYPTEFEEVTVVNQVAAPVFSPDGGAVNSGDEVEITCDTPGASIYYTTDGSDPTQESDLYSAPIAITEAITIKAIAVKEGMTDSYVSTANFTVINPSAKEVTFNFAEPSTLDPSYTDDTTTGGDNSAVILTGKTFTNGVISISFAAPESATNTNSPRLYCGTGNAAGWTLRFYKDNTITIKTADEYKITSIDFVATNLGNSSITWSAGSYSNNTWTPSTNSAIQLMSDEDVAELIIGKTATGNNPTITSMTVHYDFATGVESIEAVDNGEAVYYNLQGVRVNNPERGLFIKVQNGKATKVVK